MDNDVIIDLQRRLKALEESVAYPRIGVVSSLSPLAVKVGGSSVPFTNVKALAPVAIGQQVSVLVWGNDLLVLGAVNSGLLEGCFSVYRNAALSVGTNSGISFDAEHFDYSGWYDTGTFRFTPQLAGMYHLTCRVQMGGTATACAAFIFHGASIYKIGSYAAKTDFSNPASIVSALVLANGTTDYFQGGVNHNGVGSCALSTGLDNCFFMGHLVGRTS
jgi:hypothetical protein